MVRGNAPPPANDQARPLPNWWLSSGLLEAAGGDWSEGMLFLALLIANALFFRELAGIFAARIYRRAYWATAGIGVAAGPRANGLGSTAFWISAWGSSTLNCG